MKLGGLSWRWLGGITLVILAALGAAFWLFTAEVERLRDQELTDQLLAEGRLLRCALRDSWTQLTAHRIAGMAYALHQQGTDVVVLSADGTVLLDTLGNGRIAERLLEQPEVQTALRQGWGQSTRPGIHGPTPSQAVAVRIGSDLDELGVIWLARPQWTLVTHGRSFGRAVLAIAAVAVATVLALGLAMIRRWSSLLKRLGQAARRLAEGDLSAQAEVSGSDEFAILAWSVNETRRRLLAHAEVIDRQRRTLESLLDRLQEGVLAVDGQGRIILINPAARRLLDLKAPQSHEDRLIGRTVEECLPHHQVQRLLRARTEGPGSADAGEQEPGQAPAVEEHQLRLETAGGTVHLLARACDLRLPRADRQSDAGPAGRLLVLTDVTALRRALDLQVDFVANASHELRTPLSPIRTAVETLQQMDLAAESGQAREFIEVIDRHSARLAALASDLLDLSRLSSPTRPPQAAALPLAELAGQLAEHFAPVAKAKGLNWEIDWDRNGVQSIMADYRLLRLILDNLVDNAIQFTEAGGHVRVRCCVQPGQAIFEVEDDGCGIPEGEQQRVFERFYQVERARSGRGRGTGLGLAIVRDAVAAMQGTVQLKSQAGVGTCVTVTIPQPG